MTQETTLQDIQETFTHSRQSCKRYYKKVLTLEDIHKEIKPKLDAKRQAEYILFFWREDRPLPLAKQVSSIFIDTNT